MIAVVRDGRTGQFLRVLWDPNTNRLVRVLGPAMLSDISPGFNDPDDLVSSLPAAQIVGFVGPGAVPGGEAAARIRPPSPEPAIPTYRPLAGAMQNNRGWSRALQLTLGLADPPERIVESVVAAPRSSGDDAEAIIVTLGLQYEREEQATFVSPDILANQREIVSTALLQWGVGGASFTAEVDWQQGTMFVLPASFANVGLRVFSPPGGDVAVPGLTLTYAASLAYGYAGVQGLGSGARKTVRQNSGLAVGASFTVAIPRWATAFTFFGSLPDGDVPNVGLRVHTNPTVGPIASYRYTDLSNEANQEAAFPIPNGGRFLVVANLGPEWNAIGILYHLAFA
jgi:hypothetical protein